MYLSPSCQDKNTGCDGYNEEVMMNKLTDIVEGLLKVNGIETNRNDPGDTLSYVVQKANAYKPDLHVALHSNAFNQKARGLEVWHNGAGERAAIIVYGYLNQIVPRLNRGLKNGNLYETNMTKHPTILIEYDFHDTKEGAAFIRGNLNALAEATVKGICEYLGVGYKAGELKEHWGEIPFKSLKEKGVNINEKRFDDYMTRAEVFALLDRIIK